MRRRYRVSLRSDAFSDELRPGAGSNSTTGGGILILEVRPCPFKRRPMDALESGRRSDRPKRMRPTPWSWRWLRRRRDCIRPTWHIGLVCYPITSRATSSWIGGTLDKQDMPQTRAALIRQTAASHQSGKHHGIAYHANTNARLIAPLVFCSPLGHVNQLQEVHHWIKRTCSKRP